MNRSEVNTRTSFLPFTVLRRANEAAMRALNSLEERVSWMKLAGAWCFSVASVRIVLGER